MARSAYIPTDGYTTIDQGVLGVIKSRGTKMVRCDLDVLENWWGVAAPTVIVPIPLDKNGEPMLMCNQGHYAPKDDFGKRNDKKDHVCLKCRKIQRLNHTFTSRAEQIV